MYAVNFLILAAVLFSIGVFGARIGFVCDCGSGSRSWCRPRNGADDLSQPSFDQS